MRFITTIAILLWVLLPMGAQSQRLTYGDFIAQLKAFHPMMQQAELQPAIGDARLRLEQSVMDPYVEASYGDKAYDDKDFYTKSSLKLALPTALGVEIFTGYTENIGDQVNPEMLTSSSGQYQAGVSLPIGPDLLFNERRLAIRQAKLIVEMAEADRRILLNDLFFRASLAYLNWSLAEEAVNVQLNAIQLAEEQFEFVKSVYEGGDRPAIDTVEAFLQVQNRMFQLLEAQRTYNAALIIIENFLWDQDGNPVRLADGILPQALVDFDPFITQAQDSFMVWQQQLREDHPALQVSRLGIESLRLERQTALSGAIPQLEFKYAALSPGLSSGDIGAVDINDRMLGVALKYPLLIRKQRSKLSLVDLKSMEKNLELDTKTQSLVTKLDQFIMEFGINTQQSQLYTRMVNNYDRLLQAERTKFSLGESSVFLLNSRENKLFDAQQKQIETKAKQISSVLKVIETSNKEEIYLQGITQ